MAKLAGLVLAGGASRRMGRDKARLVANGKTLVDTMIEKLRAAGCDPVLLSGQDGIADVYPGKGPLAGMHAAFGQMGDAEAMIVVPVDMPDLRADSLIRLAQTQGEVIFYENQSLPLKLALTDKVRARLEAILQTTDGDFSIRNFVRGLEMNTLAISEINSGELTNINTPEDLQTWEKNREAKA